MDTIKRHKVLIIVAVSTLITVGLVFAIGNAKSGSITQPQSISCSTESSCCGGCPSMAEATKSCCDSYQIAECTDCCKDGKCSCDKCDKDCDSCPCKDCDKDCENCPDSKTCDKDCPKNSDTCCEKSTPCCPNTSTSC